MSCNGPDARESLSKQLEGIHPSTGEQGPADASNRFTCSRTNVGGFTAKMNVIVTGAQGQDGRLLRALLLEEGHRVLGIVRVREGVTGLVAPDTVAADLCDESAILQLIAEFQPDQLYHLAACHHSSEHRGDAGTDREMVRTNFLAAEILLAALQKLRPQCRLLMAGSSQMYSRVPDRRIVVDEDTAMSPATFYGQTKSWSRELLAHYRSRWGVFACTAILFNHESVTRPPSFLSRKVSRAVAQISAGMAADVAVRNVDAEVDWSSAQDVVHGMRLMLLADDPADYVLASGRTRRVAELLEVAFGCVGLDWRDHVRLQDASSAAEAGVLVGNPQRAEKNLGWLRRDSFNEMICKMVAYDRQLLQLEN